MRIHKFDEYSGIYNNLIIDKPEVASAYFRYVYRDKHINKDKEEDGDKKKKFPEELKFIYFSLPVSKQFVVNNLIQDLLSDSKRKGYVGVYLKAFLDDEQLTYSKLASYISGYLAASLTIQSNPDIETKNIEDIKSSIKKLLTTVNPSVNNLVLKYIADFFCISTDVLITGKGKVYSIDFERLGDIVGKENMDAKEFLKEHLELDMFEFVTENEKKAFETYIHRSARVFAEIVAEQFAIDVNEILIEEECWIGLDNFPVDRYYQLLTDKNKEIVKHVIVNLAFIDINKQQDE